jgi:hypothetical protein
MDQPAFPYQINPQYPPDATLEQKFTIDCATVKEKLHPVVDLQIPYAVAWGLLAAIQLASRHPAFGASPSCWLARDFAKRIERAIVVTDSMREIARLGWREGNVETGRPE